VNLVADDRSLIPVGSDTKEEAVTPLGEALAGLLGLELERFSLHQWTEQ